MTHAAAVDTAAIDARADAAIEKWGLGSKEHPFYLAAREAEVVEAGPALAVCCQFQTITRMFMFTTISGIGIIARDLAGSNRSDRVELGALQTAYQVIGDDLVNLVPAFNEVAPTGPGGIHYLWWQDTIRDPISALVSDEQRKAAECYPSAINELLDTMARLADMSIGPAVQLRVVEAIARDVAIALRRMLVRVRAGGEQVFEPSNLVWLDAHIRAETMHASQVSDTESGMSVIATSEEEAEQFIELVSVYASLWSRSLDGFGSLIKSGDAAPSPT